MSEKLKDLGYDYDCDLKEARRCRNRVKIKGDICSECKIDLMGD
jgi:hypothetical protein